MNKADELRELTRKFFIEKCGEKVNQLYLKIINDCTNIAKKRW